MSRKMLNEIIDKCERAGVSYGISGEVEMSSATPNVTFFTTGDTPVILYSRNISFDGGGVNAYIYRDASFTGGTEIESYNSNDLVPSDALSAAFGLAAETAAGILTRPPVYIFGNTSNQGQGSVLQAIDQPLLMLPNSIYRLVLESRSEGQAVASHLSWCEPAHIEGLTSASGAWEYVGEGFRI